jgi:TM2 domain-containing membrane protein YozV
LLCRSCAFPGIYSPRSRHTALTLAFFGGVFGLDRFYLGKISTGLVKLLTFGGFGIWWLIDLIALSSRLPTDVNGRPLR